MTRHSGLPRVVARTPYRVPRDTSQRALLMPGRASKAAKRAFGPRVKAYEALRGKGMPKRVAAAIANAGRTRAGRKSMARKAAASRKRRG